MMSASKSSLTVEIKTGLRLLSIAVKSPTPSHSRKFSNIWNPSIFTVPGNLNLVSCKIMQLGWKMFTFVRRLSIFPLIPLALDANNENVALFFLFLYSFLFVFFPQPLLVFDWILFTDCISFAPCLLFVECLYCSPFPMVLLMSMERASMDLVLVSTERASMQSPMTVLIVE